MVSKHINTKNGEVVYELRDGSYLDKNGNFIPSSQVLTLEKKTEMELKNKKEQPKTNPASTVSPGSK